MLLFRKFLLFLIFFCAIPYTTFGIDTSRPNPENDPTEVKVRIYVIDIDEIVDAQQSFKANIFIQQEWKDERLAQRDEITKYKVDEIWSPNLQFINRQKTFALCQNLLK